jgi:molybdate transport system permease protein
MGKCKDIAVCPAYKDRKGKLAADAGGFSSDANKLIPPKSDPRSLYCYLNHDKGGNVNWLAIWVTFKLASLTSAVLLMVGLPIAYWLTFSKWRWKFIVESVVALPLVLPPTVLGFYILVAIGPHSPVGRFYTDVVGHPLPFTFEGLLLASILYSLPFAVQPFTAAFEQVDRRLIETSWTLGASKLKTFFQLIVPLSTTGLITGAVLSFAHTLGEFGVVLMVGGNIEGETRTVSIDIYDEVQALNYAGAAKTALLLLVVSYGVLLLVYAMNRKVWAAWPQR